MQKYGWHGFPALVQMVKEESRVALYQEYVTMGLKILAESYVRCHGGKIDLPSFIEMTHVREKPPSAKEIIEHVKRLFKE